MGNIIVPVEDSASHWMKVLDIAIDEENYRKIANAKDINRRTYIMSDLILMSLRAKRGNPKALRLLHSTSLHSQ
ncbi:hypothetical protein [Nostoc sp.]|uniref:hypothetical protein n=1 Tax=Nostoc sp. TaxID=1180 RepID=UPI002FF602D4